MDRHNTVNGKQPIVRLRSETYARLEQLTRMTNRSIGDIASDAINFALDNSRMIEVKAYDIAFGPEGGSKR